jgi:NADH-quinone oxidoreductase subunit G
MDFPRRLFDGEGVRADVDFGPTLMLNRNRCILCTRCIRFMREVDGDAQIGVVDRGNGSEIATFNEQGVHSLLSGNLMDVCPVGAITTRQYRFRSRPWDNPTAVDTICTLCAKGCNTTGWIKAKPEWAKGSRLIRMTPRYSEEVNGFWMCDIGRFQYTWVESSERLRKPMIIRRDLSAEASAKAEGAQQVVPWKDALMRVRDLLENAGRTDAASVRFLTSAHASNEELFLLKKLATSLKGESGSDHVHVTWRRSEKRQPPDTKFRVPATDAPNVNGARDIGLNVGEGNDGDPDISGLRSATGSVAVVYVFDPGPDGSLGDVSWLIDARKNGTIGVLIYQGVLATELSKIADVVLPGAAWVEKDATYTNEKGMIQGASKVLNPPGEAVDDWQILTSVAAALGLPFTHASSRDVRADIAAAMPNHAGYSTLSEHIFSRPLPLSHWLEASNPMERWKWNVMFQDLPPVKGHNVQMEGAPAQSVIPLKLVTEEISRTSE